MRFYKFIICCLSFLLVIQVKAKDPVLMYNQFPRNWNMNFELMKIYLSKIKELGFNVVWVNPFFKTSNSLIVNRVDEGNGTPIKAKSSLYAMYDPSLIDTEQIEISDGNPFGHNATRDEVNTKIKSYTSEARAQGLVPIFDLVLNHVAKDSPLVSGSFSHFKDHLKIDTRKWFKPDTGRWDDVKEFDYSTEKNRSEIFEHLWRPLIIRAIIDFGFDGVRIDYGTDVNQYVLKRCIDLIKQLKQDAPIITFGEALIPVEKPKDDILKSCRNTGFTNLTNLAIFLTDEHVTKGKNVGYEWFLSDLGKKKWVTQGYSSNFRLGTIGFSGSHDHGTTLQATVKNTVTQNEIEAKKIDEENIPTEFSENDKLVEKIVRGKIVDERIQNMEEQQRMLLAKKRMAIAAFSSDAGWYFMAGDEKLSTITKRPFIKQDGTPFGGGKDDMDSINITDAIPRFVKNINETFKQIREASETFWVEIFLSKSTNEIYFVRHLSGNRVPVDIVVVNCDSNQDYSNKTDVEIRIKQYLQTQNAEIDWSTSDSTNIKFYFVK